MTDAKKANALHWRINCFCNRRCPFCYGPQGKHEVDLEACLPVIDRFLGFGITTFILTGGEPLLSKKVDQVLSHLRANEAKVVLYTNCDYFDFHEDVIASCVDTLCLPIDGASEYTHDMVRGKNNMRAVVGVLDRYALGSSPLKVKVGTVVARNNITELPAINYLLDKYKISMWKLYQYLRYSDRDLQKLWTTQHLEVTDSEYRAATQFLFGSDKRRTPISLSTEYDRESSYFMMNPDLDIIVPLRGENGIFEDKVICSAVDRQPVEIEELWKSTVDLSSYDKNLRASGF